MLTSSWFAQPMAPPTDAGGALSLAPQAWALDSWVVRRLADAAVAQDHTANMQGVLGAGLTATFARIPSAADLLSLRIHICKPNTTQRL